MGKAHWVLAAVLVAAPVFARAADPVQEAAPTATAPANASKAPDASAPGDIRPAAIVKAIEKNGGHAFADAEADIAAAKARLDAAESGLMPRLGLSATGKYYETTESAYDHTDNREAYGTLELVQPIYDFGHTSDLIKSRRAKVAAAKAKALEARHMVMLEGLALYYDLQASELRVRALYEAHSSAYVTWDHTKRLAKMGRASPIEVADDLAKVEKTRLAYYEERARNSNYRARLTDLTGLTFGEELVEPPQAPKKKAGDIDVDVVTKAAIEKNPEILVLADELDAVRAERAGIGSRPRLEAFGDLNRYTRSLRGRDEWAAGARISWPIFDGGLNTAEKAGLAAEEAKISARLDVAKRNLAIRIQHLVTERDNAFQGVIAARASLDYASRVLLQRQRQYEQEKVTRLGFAMINDTHAEADVVKAAGRYFMVNARLAMVLGASPAMSLQKNFLNALTGGKAVRTLERFVPKEGSGFGQDDANKVNNRR